MKNAPSLAEVLDQLFRPGVAVQQIGFFKVSRHDHDVHNVNITVIAQVVGPAVMDIANGDAPPAVHL